MLHLQSDRRGYPAHERQESLDVESVGGERWSCCLDNSAVPAFVALPTGQDGASVAHGEARGRVSAPDAVQVAGLQAAERGRQERARSNKPTAHLDWIIVQLEDLHLSGHKRVPKRLVRYLRELDDILPEPVVTPTVWRGSIRDVIDQCFDLQERLWRSGPRAPLLLTEDQAAR